MSNEIKEILDYLKDFIEEDRLEQINLNRWFISSLLDYITNLQEELEDLRESDWAWHQTLKIQNKREYRSKFLKEFQEEFGTNTFPDYDEIYKRYDKVKKENEELKELCNKYEEEHSTTFNEWKETITDKYQTLKDLQEENERLEKRNKEIYDGFIATQEELSDYATRNEKAIEYIRNNAWYCYKDNEEILDRIGIEKILSILGNENE